MFRNVYEDAHYAASYAALDWVGTYALIQRDLPGILRQHVAGRRALDFGCGTGRSTRLLRACGFDAIGVDVSPAMIDGARRLDAGGAYHLLEGDGLAGLPARDFDLVLASFPFDNIPAADKPGLLVSIRQALAPSGRFVNIVSSPEIYTHEWASFSTRAWPENREARDGDVVRIVTRDFPGGTPCEDVFCTDAAYRELYGSAGLAVVAVHQPLADGSEDTAWESETHVPPWVIYVLGAT